MAGAGSVAAAAAQTARSTSSLIEPSRELTGEATDDAFTVPSWAAAGRHLVTLDDGSSQIIEAVFVGLPSGVDADTFQALFAAPTLPPWIDQTVSVAGPGGLTPAIARRRSSI